MKNLLLCIIAFVLAATACLPPVTCTPGAARCDDDTPTTCSSTGREWAVSSPRVRCAEVGGVCDVRDGVAACVPVPVTPVTRPADAGVSRFGREALSLPAKGGV